MYMITCSYPFRFVSSPASRFCDGPSFPPAYFFSCGIVYVLLLSCARLALYPRLLRNRDFRLVF